LVIVATGTVLAVVGPTAVGKSALGVTLARRLGGEVVNADSMQLYRGMDIGTAKVTPAEAGGVPHHVLDLWDVTEPASVAEYQRVARAAVDGLLAAGRVPVLVGGSGLYVRAVLDRMEFPGTDPALRAEVGERRVQPGPDRGRLPREVEPVERAAQVQPRPADQDRQRAPRRDRGDLGAGQRLVLGDGRRLGNRPHVEQVVRHPAALVRRQLRGADVHARVQLHRVGVHDLAADRVGEPQCQVGLPGRGGPDDGDDQFRHDDQSVRDSSQEATR